MAFTHCGVGLGSTSLQNTISTLIAQNALKVPSTSSTNILKPQFLLNETSAESWIPFSGLSKLSFICLGSTAEPYFQTAIEFYQQLIDVSGQNGQLFIAHIESEASKMIKNTYNGTNGDATVYPTTAQWKNEIITRLIDDVCEINYKPFEANLNCGEYHKLESPIIIWPSPMVGFTQQKIQQIFQI